MGKSKEEADTCILREPEADGGPTLIILAVVHRTVHGSNTLDVPSPSTALTLRLVSV